MTALLLPTLSACGTTIHDHIFCSPIPGTGMAACDHFLKHDPKTLSAEEWAALKASWLAKGWVLEVTESDAVGTLKQELEELCSKTQCNEDTSDSVNAVVGTLSRMQDTASRARALVLEAQAR